MIEKKLHNLSLHILPQDDRDYSFSKKFGVLGVEKLPTQDFTIYDATTHVVKWTDTLSKIASIYYVSVSKILKINPQIKNPNIIKVGSTIKIPAPEMKILNQIDLDFCAGFSITAISMALWVESFDPYYQFAKIKQISGEYKSWGANLRDACKSLVKFGSLPASKAPYTHWTEQVTDRDRDFLANWLNYPTGLDDSAAKYKAGAFYNADGPYDAFDNFRMTLFKNIKERRGVLVGVNWRPEWTGATLGVISDSGYSVSSGAGHAVFYIGQKTINGEIHLIMQNSWGDIYGNKGIFYVPRSVVNKEYAARYGAFTATRNKSSYSLGDSAIAVLSNLVNLFK